MSDSAFPPSAPAIDGRQLTPAQQAFADLWAEVAGLMGVWPNNAGRADSIVHLLYGVPGVWAMTDDQAADAVAWLRPAATRLRLTAAGRPAPQLQPTHPGGRA